MSILSLPVQPTGTESRFETTIVLEAVRYRFAFYTNAIDRRWYMDVENGDDIVRGIPLSNGTDLLYPYRHLAMPPGLLFLDVEDDGDCDLEAFAEGRARLIYAEVGS